MHKKIGILAIQGSFAEHGQALKSMGIDFVWVKDQATLASVSHLIMPGGESTTMRKLLKDYEMWEVIEARVSNDDNDLRILGTCAGAILLSDFMDIQIDRNAYGAQQSSFVDTIESDILGDMEGVFIRAPKIKSTGSQVEIIATYKDEPVLVRQDKYLACAFHPELTMCETLYQYFFNL